MKYINMKRHISAAIAVMGIIFGSTPSFAAVLVNYDFTTNTNPSQIDEAILASASAFTPTWDISLANNGMGRGTSGGTAPNMFARLNVIPEMASTAYFSFSLTPDVSQNLNLESISFNAGYANSTNANGHPAYTVWYSVQISYGETVGYAGSPQSYTAPATTLAASFSQGNLLTFDLSAYQEISSPVTFTIFLSKDPTTAGASETARIDNVSVVGTAVPEPGTAVLGGIGMAFLLFRRRFLSRVALVASGTKP